METFRYTTEQTAQQSHGRRLADSNCCPVPLLLAQPCGSEPFGADSGDFVTRTTVPVNTAGAALSSDLGVCHPSVRDHRGGHHLHGVAVRPHSTLRYLADVARRGRVASVCVVDAAGVVRSPARVGGLASRRHDVDGRAVPVFRRDAVPRRDLGVGRRHGFAVGVVAAGADVSVVAGVDA